jgi:hypothetical protein
VVVVGTVVVMLVLLVALVEVNGSVIDVDVMGVIVVAIAMIAAENSTCSRVVGGGRGDERSRGDTVMGVRSPRTA